MSSNGHETHDWNQPSWWRTETQQQLERAHQFWPNVDLPEPPANFVPQTATEVSLLHVPDSFLSLWSKAGGKRPPPGFTPLTERPYAHVESIYRPFWDDRRAATVKFLRTIGISPPYQTSFHWKRSGARLNSKPLPIDLDNDPEVRLRQDVPVHAEPVWLGFDPENRKGIYDDSVPEKSYLAASEVLSALIQFPNWPFTWFNGALAPKLAGYERFSRVSPIGQQFWDSVPYLDRWDDAGMIVLSFQDHGYWEEDDWTYPRVRVLTP